MRNGHQQSLYNQKRDALIAYARKLTCVPLVSTGGSFRMPVERKGARGIILCGLPINCCDPREAAEGYIVIGGERMGLCGLAARVFRATQGVPGLGEHTDRIRVMRNLVDAGLKAARTREIRQTGLQQRPGLKRLARQDRMREESAAFWADFDRSEDAYLQAMRDDADGVKPHGEPAAQ